MIQENITNLFANAIEEAMKERGHINLLIAGRTGVGKSTLINSVFQEKMADTGQGKPVTQNTREITKQGIPLTIFDTRGLEMVAFKETLGELEALISERCTDLDLNRHIHIAWICVQEDGRRVEDAEIDLHNMLVERVPTLAVVTKARADNGFRAEVQRLLPKAKNVVRVRAISETLDEGYHLPPMGLEELVEATSELIPDGIQKAFTAAQRASLKYKSAQSQKVVLSAGTAAAAAGASPIPFSDVAILVPIQVGMLAKITSIFGLELSKGSLSTLVASVIGVTSATLAGRAIVTNLLKMIPGGGTLVGGAIAATTASALTLGLGMAYIAVLEAILKENPDANPDVEYIALKLKEKMKSIKLT